MTTNSKRIERYMASGLQKQAGEEWGTRTAAQQAADYAQYEKEQAKVLARMASQRQAIDAAAKAKKAPAASSVKTKPAATAPAANGVYANAGEAMSDPRTGKGNPSIYTGEPSGRAR